MRSVRCKITFFNFYFQDGSYQLGTEITFQITNKRVALIVLCKAEYLGKCREIKNCSRKVESSIEIK